MSTISRTDSSSSNPNSNTNNKLVKLDDIDNENQASKSRHLTALDPFTDAETVRIKFLVADRNFVKLQRILMTTEADCTTKMDFYKKEAITACMIAAVSGFVGITTIKLFDTLFSRY